MQDLWGRTAGIRRAGYVDGLFAVAFLALLAILLWPALLGTPGLWWPLPLFALALVAFAPTGHPGFWPSLRDAVLLGSGLILLGAAGWHGGHGRLEPVTQSALVVLCLGLAWRSRVVQDRG